MAIAHVRGGGEYGEEWHQGGMLQNEPNTWRDFIRISPAAETADF